MPLFRTNLCLLTLTSVVLLLSGTHTAQAQVIVQDDFEDGAAGFNRTNRGPANPPNFIPNPYYLASSTTAANLQTSATTPIAGVRSLRLTNAARAAGVFSTAAGGIDFSQVGTEISLTVLFRYETSPALAGSLRIGLYSGVPGTLADTTTDFNSFPGLFTRLSSQSATGASNDQMFFEPVNQGDVGGGSGLVAIGNANAGANSQAGILGGTMGTTTHGLRFTLNRTSDTTTQMRAFFSADGNTYSSTPYLDVTADNVVPGFNFIGINNNGNASVLFIDNVSLVVSTSAGAVPEPGTLPLLGVGAAAFLARIIRRRRTAK